MARDFEQHLYYCLLFFCLKRKRGVALQTCSPVEWGMRQHKTARDADFCAPCGVYGWVYRLLDDCFLSVHDVDTALLDSINASSAEVVNYPL